jgi:hypothetical protein
MIRIAQAVMTSIVVGNRIISKQEVKENKLREEQRREALSEYTRWNEDNQRLNKNLMR